MSSLFSSSRQKIAIFFSLLSSIFIFTTGFTAIFLMKVKIEERSKQILENSLSVMIADYSRGEISENQIALQLNNNDLNSATLPNIADESLNQKRLFKSKDAQISQEKLGNLNQEAANQSLNQFENNENLSVTDDFKPENYQVYSRIILENGDILSSSDLFNEYFIDPEDAGFNTLYDYNTCVYALSHEISSGSYQGDIIQVGQYCPFPDSQQRSLYQNIFSVTLFLMFITYFVGLFAAKYFLRPLEKSVEKTKEFAQNVYHELLTPLTVAMTSADLAGKSQNYKKGIDDLKEDLKDMRNTLLLLKHQTLKEQEKLLLNEIDLQKIIFEISEEFKKNKVQLDLSYVDKVYKKANLTGIRLIFKNLFSNAIKYCEEGSKITVMLNENFFSIENCVEDIDKIEVERFFQRNYRGENALDKSGRGVGLAIVKELIDAHNWQIDASIKGTRVLIKIYF